MLVRRREQAVCSSYLQRFCIQILGCGLAVLRKLDLFADPPRSVWLQPHGTSSSILQSFLHISAAKGMRLPHSSPIGQAIFLATNKSEDLVEQRLAVLFAKPLNLDRRPT